MFNFSVDEKNYLNANALDVSFDDFIKRLKLHISCNKLAFATDEFNDMVVGDMLGSLYARISVFSSDEWDELQEILPFSNLEYSVFDNEEFYEHNSIEV